MAQTDKFRKAKSLFATTLSAGIGTGTSDTITPASVTGLPTDTEITLTFDRVDSGGTETPTKMERITGTISGGNLTAYTRGIDGSTEQAHASGAVIEYIWNADDLNDIVDGILVEHDQDGGHNDITADSVTSAGTVEADELTIQSANVRNGWFAADETWTYSAWDDTNGVSTATITVPSDATTKYQAGMRVKFTQSTGGTKYGIITKVEATTLTVFVNTDYQLENEAITAPFYSPMDIPFGFVKDTSKYQVKITDTSDTTQTSPVSGTYYNINSNSIDVPIGSWWLSYEAVVATNRSAGTCSVRATLSDANNTESDKEYSTRLLTISTTDLQGMVYHRNLKSLSAKDTFYLNVQTDQSSVTNIRLLGGVRTVIIRAICAYL